MKLRLLPVFMTMILSASVLFGGWFVYQTVAMEDPLLKDVSAIEGVTEATLELTREQAIVNVKLSADVDLKSSYRAIAEASEDKIGSRELKVVVTGGDRADEEMLNQWWSNALFDVAQAMETRQYSLIPLRLQELARKEGSGLEATASIDEENVYVTLKHGASRKDIILPRVSAMTGVWPNE